MVGSLPVQVAHSQFPAVSCQCNGLNGVLCIRSRITLLNFLLFFTNATNDPDFKQVGWIKFIYASGEWILG